MANKYLALRVGDQTYTLGSRKLGVNSGTGALVVPVENEDGKLTFPDAEGQPSTTLLTKDTTSGNTVLGLKGSGGGAAFALNKETVTSISEDLAVLIPEGFSIELNSAVLTLNKRPVVGSTPATTQHVLGASFGVTLDLSSIPFMSKIVPPDFNVVVENFQIVMASTPFDRNDTAALKVTLPQDTLQLPNSLNQGANLSLELTVGGEPFILTMPLPQSKPKTESSASSGSSTSGTVNTSQTSSSDPTASPPSGPAPVKKRVGPISVDSVGLGYKDGRFQLLVDGSVNIAGFSLGLIGLAINIPAEDVITPRFDRIRLALQGMSLGYQNGALSMTGILLRLPIIENDEETGRHEYLGQIAIRTSKLAITGMGIYTELPGGKASAFIYASLITPLGGIPEFFIEGIALGMGYNRGMRIIPTKMVNRFPLVTALDPSRAGAGQANTNSVAHIKGQFAILSTYLPAMPGQYVMAIGLRVSTYKMVNSIAVAMIEFGERLRLQIVGLASMQLPPASTGLPALGNIEMAFRIQFDPEQGVFAIDSLLTENSYLLTPECRLTGGFAFYTWYKGPYAGDFVVSMGGYHPQFNKPAHYPTVARLALSLDMSPVRFKGQLYAALTPSAIMAGGRFEASLKVGRVSAWYTANMDFIISWSPFFYDARFSVRIGIRVKLLFTLKAEIGTDIHIWGPEFAGHAKVKLKVYTASFDFGAVGKPSQTPVSWLEFSSTFLPERSDVLKLQITKGQLAEYTSNNNGETLFIVDPDEFELSIDSQLPVNMITKDRETAHTGNDFAVAPMGGTTVTNWNLNVTCESDLASASFVIDPANKKMSLALWGDSQSPNIRSKERTRSLLSGAIVTPSPGIPPGVTEPVALSEFLSQDVVENDPHWQFGQWEREADLADHNGRGRQIQDTLVAEGPASQRDAVCDFFGHPKDQIQVSSMAGDLASSFMGVPQILKELS